MESRYSRRVTRKLILYILVFSTLLGVLATAVQVHQEYRRSVAALEDVFDDVRKLSSGGIAQALWVRDLAQLRVLVVGVVDQRHLSSIEIREGGAPLVIAGALDDPPRAVRRVFPIDYLHEGRAVRIGETHVVADLDVIYRQLFDHAWVILFWSVVQTFFVAAFAFVLFTRLVIRHVDGIANYFESLDPADQPPLLELDRYPNPPLRRDEFDMLVGAINDLMGRLKRSQEEVQLGRDEIEASAQRYRAILDAMLDTYYRTDNDGRLLMLSPSVERLLGWRPEELIGHNLGELYVDPGGRDHFIRELLEAGGNIQGYENRLYHKDGRVVWISASARVIRNENRRAVGVEGVARDITVQREAAEAIRDSERQLRLVADSLPALVLYVDKTLHFRFANKEAASWYGRPAEEVMGMSARNVVDRAANKRLQPRWDGVLRGQPQTFTERFTYPDGKTRDVELSFVPHRREDGTVEGFFALGVDVTERRALESRLRQSQKMEALGQLTGGVAHDFNNLLGVILGNVELLLEEPDLAPEERAKMLSSILRVGARGSGLTRQLLTFSRRQPVTRMPTDIEAVLTDFSNMLQRTLGEEVSLEIRSKRKLRPCLTDRSLLENALLNLALNSRDAMPNGGRLSIETDTFDATDAAVAAAHELEPGHYISITISDTGSGMPADVLAHAFEPFYTTKDVGEGTGLGLSMVYGFVHQSGGGVTISSVEGEGTEVVIYLPAMEGNVVMMESKMAEPDERGSGERILVVEDDADLRQTTAETLKRMGYTVEVAPDGPSAMELLGKDGGFDLLLTDIRLPNGMLGIEVARRARAENPALKVVYMTGYADAAVFAGDNLEDSENLLRKPFRRLELSQALNRALGQDAASSG